MSSQMICRRAWVVLVSLTLFPMHSEASESAAEQQVELVDLSLEELMDLRVTSAARKPQRAGDVTSAVFVITQDDIPSIRSDLRP